MWLGAGRVLARQLPAGDVLVFLVSGDPPADLDRCTG